MARRVPSMTEATASVVCLRSFTNSRKPASNIRSMLAAGRRELTMDWNNELRSEPLQKVRSKSSDLRRVLRRTKALRKMYHQEISDIASNSPRTSLTTKLALAISVISDRSVVVLTPPPHG